MVFMILLPPTTSQTNDVLFKLRLLTWSVAAKCMKDIKQEAMKTNTNTPTQAKM